MLGLFLTTTPYYRLFCLIYKQQIAHFCRESNIIFCHVATNARKKILKNFAFIRTELKDQTEAHANMKIYGDPYI